MSRKNSALLQKFALPLLTVAMFFGVCLSSAETVKGSAVFFVLLAVAGGVVGFKRLRERFSLPMMALGLFVLMGGISTFYAVAGKFALQEFLKLLISFCLATFMLAVAPGKDTAPERRIASVLEGFTAIAGVVSIDMISTRILSDAVTGLLQLFSSDYSTDATGLEVGTRIYSVFQNPNVFASIVGLGVLLSLGLTLSSENKRERTMHLICLYCNALSFLLAFSMGASAFIAAAFLVYLLMELPQRRAHLFVLMVETLVLTLLSTAVISMTSFDAWDGIQPIPLLCIAFGAAMLWLSDTCIGQTLGEKLSGHGRLLTILISGVLAAIAAFALLAYNLTGGIALNAGENLRRSVYPAPGEYTLTAEYTGTVKVTVKYQNKQDTMMHTETTLYSGPLSDAAFTVPEDSLVVYFTFSSSDSAYLESVECTGTESVSVPLGYKLLPSFIANRLQGLFANENAIQRTVFFDDGMKIFAKNPLFGRGLGSYENGIKSVQSFYYETKYAHNHYIQALAETGIIGLVTFILALAVAAAALVFDRRRKDACHTLTPALTAALVFMVGHAFMEVNFSYYAYLPIAFAVFALISMCCGDAIPLPKLTTVKVKTYAVLFFAALTVVFSGFLNGNISANNLVDTKPTMDNVAKAVEMDKFEYADHMLTYVLGSAKFPSDQEIQAKAFEYSERLSELDSNTVPFYLAQYYFAFNYNKAALNMLDKYLHYVASDEKAWANALELIRKNYDPSPEYEEGVKRIVEFYKEWTANNIGTIELSEMDQVFLSAFGLERTDDTQ